MLRIAPKSEFRCSHRKRIFTAEDWVQLDQPEAAGVFIVGSLRYYHQDHRLGYLK